MTGFNSQVGGGEYHIQFETDNRKHYERVQQTIRDCMDGAQPEKAFVLHTPLGSVELMFPACVPDETAAFIRDTLQEVNLIAADKLGMAGGCERCRRRVYSEKPFEVTTHTGHKVYVPFNFCPVCGRNMKED